MQPIYPTPWPLLFRLVRSLFLRQRLSFHKEAQEAASRIAPPICILGKENIPNHGPCLLTVNHYFRPGFGAWWIALGIAANLPIESHWMMAAGWTYPNQGAIGKFKEAVTHWAFVQVSHILETTAMPPMPPRPQDVVARAEAVRQVLSFARRHPEAVIGIAPEGGDSPGGVLALPASGVGRFIFQLARLGMPVTPVGAFESEGIFRLNFGKQYELLVPEGLATDERDVYVRQKIMCEIAPLVPEALRGDFAKC